MIKILLKWTAWTIFCVLTSLAVNACFYNWLYEENKMLKMQNDLLLKMVKEKGDF